MIQNYADSVTGDSDVILISSLKVYLNEIYVFLLPFYRNKFVELDIIQRLSCAELEEA